MKEEIPEIIQKIGESIKSLDLNKNEKKHADYLEKTIMAQTECCIETGSVPLFCISSCVCGCGNLFVTENSDVLTPQKTIKLLELHIEAMKNNLKNAN